MSVQRIKQEIQAAEENLNSLHKALKKAEAMSLRPVGTKFKWIRDAQNYRVAIQTKKGLLQVKVVTNGVGDYHDEGCPCNPCGEIRLSNGQIPPWRRSRPLKRTLFDDETSWHASFDDGSGEMIITSAPIPQDIRRLCLVPLQSTTDALKLNELEGRFSGATFTLIVPTKSSQIWPQTREYDVAYYRNGTRHLIACEDSQISLFNFSDFGEDSKLMVRWRGYCFLVSHLV
jgi:hypothetical protein